MTSPTYRLSKPLIERLSISRLSTALRLMRYAQVTVASGGILVLMVVCLQLSYPLDRARPFMSVAGISTGAQSQNQVSENIEKLNASSKVTLQVGTHTYKLTPKAMGVKLDESKTAALATSYSLAERLTPFSLFKRSFASTLPKVVDTQAVSDLTQKIVKENTVEPVDASLTRQDDGAYKLKNAVVGTAFDESKTRKSLTDMHVGMGAVVAINGTPQMPAITDETVTNTLQKYEALADKSLKVVLDNKTYEVTGATIKSWALVTIDTSKKSAQLTYDLNLVKGYIRQTLPSVITAPQTSVVTLQNGLVQARGAASAGIGLDLDKTVKLITDALTHDTASINASTRVLSPIETYSKQFTNDTAGLNALIADWAKSYPSMKASVSFRDIGGEGRSAGINENTQFSAASLYKLFTAWYVYDGIERGVIQESTTVVNGKNVIQCIEAMIVVSDNPCGEAFGNTYGWQTLNTFVTAHGYGAMVFTSLPTKTSSDTVARFLLALKAGSLMSANHTEQFLGYMRRQIYRSAIPAGTSGAVVADKVGFGGSTWNDAAIVETSKRTYVLTVLTQGAGPSAIKDLAQRLAALN